VLVASAGEVLGSLILGLYAYRRGGIPAFVPPGHGLIYLAGCRLAQSGFVREHASAVVGGAAAAGAAWAVLGLLAVGGRPDVVGALAILALVAFLARGRRPSLFACMFLVVAVLELYGTRMGTWTWSAHWPGLHLSMANPPSGVAAGYCAFDALALILGPRLLRLAGYASAMRRNSASASCSVSRSAAVNSRSNISSSQPSRWARVARRRSTPAGVSSTSTRRPSSGSGRRETRPAPSRSRTVCAIDCGRIRSAAARSLVLAGPSRSSRPSTAIWPSGG
jgi:hypothetical protein